MRIPALQPGRNPDLELLCCKELCPQSWNAQQINTLRTRLIGNTGSAGNFLSTFPRGCWPGWLSGEPEPRLSLVWGAQTLPKHGPADLHRRYSLFISSPGRSLACRAAGMQRRGWQSLLLGPRNSTGFQAGLSRGHSPGRGRVCQAGAAPHSRRAPTLRGPLELERGCDSIPRCLRGGNPSSQTPGAKASTPGWIAAWQEG